MITETKASNGFLEIKLIVGLWSADAKELLAIINKRKPYPTILTYESEIGVMKLGTSLGYTADMVKGEIIFNFKKEI